ncbi:MAG TPA: MFS transporter [Polyangia bacterium]|nr:MFS transporter [Polyangia bacterium]
MTAETIESVPPRAGRREWLGLAVIALPCLIYSMDLTVLNLALPRIATALKPSSAKLLWIVDIYGFCVAGLLVTMGNLGDRIGRRRLLSIGAAAFGAASVAAASARSTDMLIAARALLGIAGATLAPSTLSLIRNMFLDRRQRTFAIGVWTSSYAIGGAIGPLLGGAMLQYFRWGSVFLLAVPPMALLLLVGPVLLPESRDANAKPMDLRSALLSLAAVLCLIYGLKTGVQSGLGSVPLLAVAAGVGLAALFVRRQSRLDDPLIDVQLLRTRAFGVSLGIYMLATLITFGAYVLLGQYLQLVLGLSPLASGLWMLPWSASYVLGSFLAPLLARRFQPASVMTGGLLLAATGFLAAALLVGQGVGAIIAASTLYSLGLSPVFTLGIDTIIAAAPPQRAGAASAISETSSELGGALGIALFGSLATAIYRGALARAESSADFGDVPRPAWQVARDTLGGANAEAALLPARAGARLLDTARAAFSDALRVTTAICAVVAALTAVLTFLALRRIRASAT